MPDTGMTEIPSFSKSKSNLMTVSINVNIVLRAKLIKEFIVQ